MRFVKRLLRLLWYLWMGLTAQSVGNRVRSTTCDNRCYVKLLWYISLQKKGWQPFYIIILIISEIEKIIHVEYMIFIYLFDFIVTTFLASIKSDNSGGKNGITFLHNELVIFSKIANKLIIMPSKSIVLILIRLALCNMK